MGKLIDLIGNRFGRLLVTNRADNRNKRTYWHCICDCGNECDVESYSLIHGITKSCGCLHKEIISKSHKKYNEYYVCENIVFVKFSNCEEYFICDLEDWNELKQYCWSKNPDGYAYNVKNSLLFHRVVMNCQNGLEVDHINGISNDDICDNRKSNLRVVTRSQNNMNHSIRKDNTSGHTGVSWNKAKNKFEVEICVNGNRIKLGRFNNIEDAIKVREEAEIKYFGEYRYGG